jgi:hypothetical protein
VQVDESFVETLLDDVLCVFLDTGEAPHDGKSPSLVTPDENFKCVSISTFGGKDECRFFVLARDALSLQICKLA